ncbi:PREDICTED: RNA pseudouridylate synthase domain-containing protein 1-like [Priapulus caudatus]|uniref:RNA pseudouridylate synthase domain-containing protein 1-like n=1 Tax=Priapulus caudatus TaxID=37621 RepID=A0ABM1EBL9_PRICU|nr:PREDICTED: RNA pseudouridylate synthase domain-containing protein 1-like [Priapulus caudatus]
MLFRVKFCLFKCFSIFLNMINLLAAMLRNSMLWKAYDYIRIVFSGTKKEAVPDLVLLYKSDNFFVVNKPYDMLINSVDETRKATLADLLRDKLPHMMDPTVTFGFRFVHRLDYSTSGAICLAFTKDAAAAGMRALVGYHAKKFYLALLRGHIQQDMVHIEKPIGGCTAELDIHKMCTSDSPLCKKPRYALTHLAVLERGEYDGEPATKVLVKLHTGRRHQIRVHCDHIGYRVVGDYTYSNRTDTTPFRMMLHSHRLSIAMAMGETVEAVAPDPFTSEDVGCQWRSTEHVCSIDDAMQKLNEVKRYSPEQT